MISSSSLTQRTPIQQRPSPGPQGTQPQGAKLPLAFFNLPKANQLSNCFSATLFQNLNNTLNELGTPPRTTIGPGLIATVSAEIVRLEPSPRPNLPNPLTQLLRSSLLTAGPQGLYQPSHQEWGQLRKGYRPTSLQPTRKKNPEWMLRSCKLTPSTTPVRFWSKGTAQPNP